MITLDRKRDSFQLLWIEKEFWIHLPISESFYQTLNWAIVLENFGGDRLFYLLSSTVFFSSGVPVGLDTLASAVPAKLLDSVENLCSLDIELPGSLAVFLIISVKLSSKSHSPGDVDFSVFLSLKSIFFTIRDFRIEVSSCCRSARLQVQHFNIEEKAQSTIESYLHGHTIYNNPYKTSNFQ